ncbi:MAG: RNA polymerase sigma factor [Janthinobacterium lividum]
MRQEDPDTDLLARVGEQDPAAIREMVAAKLPRLLALATRMLGESDEARDVTQEVFMRIWKHAADWQPEQAHFDTWLHRVTLNLCYDRLRRRQNTVSVDDAPESIDQAPTLDEQLDQTARNHRITAALAALPARQREALVLQYYQELSNVEAAGLMGISVDALESLLARARRSLRGHLTAERAAPAHEKDRQ